MTDLLIAQAAIRSKYHPDQPRSSGKFATAAAAIQTRVAFEKRTDRLAREVEETEHARGRVYQRKCFRSLPNVGHADTWETAAEDATLFDAVAA